MPLKHVFFIAFLPRISHTLKKSSMPTNLSKVLDDKAYPKLKLPKSRERACNKARAERIESFTPMPKLNIMSEVVVQENGVGVGECRRFPHR